MSTLKVSKFVIRNCDRQMIALNKTQDHKSFNGMTNTVNVDLMLIQLSFYSHFYLPSPVIAPYLINMHVMQTFKETIYFNFFTIISILVLVDEPEPFVKVFLVRVFFVVCCHLVVSLICIAVSISNIYTIYTYSLQGTKIKIVVHIHQ